MILRLSHNPSRPAPVRPECGACGSIEVVRDAWAAWDGTAGCWTLEALFDHAFCKHCDAATTLVWQTPEPREADA